MTVYRKSFPEGTALLVHRLIEGSKDPRLNEISRGCTRCRGVVILGTELWKADGVSLLVDC